MKKKRPTVDTHCYDLAEWWLNGIAGATDDDFWDLAGEIQHACETASQDIETRRKAEAEGQAQGKLEI